MRFRVGPWVWRVRISDAELLSGRKAAAGLCDWAERTIWISGVIPVRRRLAVLLHELRHCWQHDMGRPGDDESDADQAASFAADVWRQLERQGGEKRLMQLGADGISVAGAVADEPAEPRNHQCPTCGGYLDLPIGAGQPTFDAKHNRLVAERWGDCEFCTHRVTWIEAVTSSGVPTGSVLGQPRIIHHHHAFAV